MKQQPHKVAIGLSLLLAVFLWGGSNTGTKFVVSTWPPIWTGASRFLCAGAVLWSLLRFTNWFGTPLAVGRELGKRLWLGGGLSLAAYILTFNWALRYTAVSHVALYLGASPVWALVWEGWPERSLRTVQRYAAAVLAMLGVVLLFLPALRTGHAGWFGEVLGLTASVLWTNYARQCRALGAELSGAEISAHTMWRAGVWLLPAAAVEVWQRGLVWRADLVWVHSYCILVGGVITFAIWNRAMRYWPASQVLLFNNLIPLCTMTWAWACLGEPVTKTFWMAMLLVMMGVTLGQMLPAKVATGEASER